MKNKVISCVLLLCVVISSYVSFKVYRSYVQQYYLITDLNDNNWNSRSWEFVESIETDIPNLSLTALPLKAMKAQYFLYNDSILSGLDLIEETIRERANPYIMFPEAVKAKLFTAVGDIDSSYYYSRKAYDNLPRNAFHFAELSRTLSAVKEYDSITHFFKPIKYSPDEQIWKIYLASITNYIDVIQDKDFAIETAYEALEIFPNQKDVLIAAYFVIHGKENTTRALELENEGRDLFDQKLYNEALEVYKEADSLLGSNYVFKENIASSYFNLKDWDQTINNLVFVENQKHDLDGLQNYMLGLSYFNLGDKSSSCGRLQLSIEQGFTESSNAWNILCNFNLRQID
jgi:hypothetical protein